MTMEVLESAARVRNQILEHHELLVRHFCGGAPPPIPENQSTLRVLRLRGAILETVEALEGTRKSFKSRQLEMLRKKLLRVLAENA